MAWEYLGFDKNGFRNWYKAETKEHARTNRMYDPITDEPPHYCTISENADIEAFVAENKVKK